MDGSSRIESAPKPLARAASCLVVLATFSPVGAEEDARAIPGDPRPAVLEGIVLSPGGRPVSGATILAVCADVACDPEGATEEDRPVATSLADDAGRFRVEVHGREPFNLVARGDGYARSTLRAVREGEPVVVRLAEGAELNGAVFDATTGEPVPGAAIVVQAAERDGFVAAEHDAFFTREAASGDRGRFRCDRLAPDYYRVSVTADGYSREIVERIEVGLPGRAPAPVALYLVPGVTLAGRVVAAADESPVEGVRIAVIPTQPISGGNAGWARAGDLSGVTDGEGSFELRGVPLAGSYALELRHDDYAPAWLDRVVVRRAGGRSEPLNVKLDRGTRLSARLLTRERPFEGDVSLTFVYHGRDSGFTPTLTRRVPAELVEHGKIVLHGLPPGTVTLKLQPGGYPQIVRERLVLSADTPAELGEILLEAGPTIRGTVLAPDGRPLADADVVAVASFPGRFDRRSVRSEADGSFVLHRLNELPYAVHATARGYGRSDTESLEPDAGNLELHVTRAGAVRGRVVAGDPLRPLVGFVVTVEGQRSGRRVESVFRDESGSFEVEGLSSGTVALRVEATGFVPARLQDVEIAAGATEDLGDVVLERGATLRGIVVDGETGRPIPGVRAEVGSPTLPTARRGTGPGSSGSATGSDGSFSIAGLAPGRHDLRFEHARYATKKRSVEIAAGEPPPEVLVELGQGGAIAGTLRGTDGRPLAHAMVVAVSGLSLDPKGRSETDEHGVFRMEKLTPGSYRVVVVPRSAVSATDGSAGGASARMQVVEVVDGETAHVAFASGPSGITVSGTVREGKRSVRAKLMWTLSSRDRAAGRDVAIADADDAGAFQLVLASPGRYRVSVQPDGRGRDDTGGGGFSVEVDIPAGETRVIRDLNLSEFEVSGAVLDAETGRPLGGVRVVALRHRDGEPAALSAVAADARTDEEGRYSFGGLGEGAFRLVFSRTGYGGRSVGPFEIEGSDEHGFDAALDRAWPVRVRVVDATGYPVTGAIVSAQALPTGSVAGATGRTDGNGELILTGLPEGTHDLGVVAPGYGPTIAAVQVGPESEAPEPIALQPGAPLTIRLVDVEDRPVADATVRIREKGGSDLSALLTLVAVLDGRGLWTGSDGTVHVEDVAAGRYEVEARWAGQVVSTTVQVHHDGTNLAELNLR